MEWGEDTIGKLRALWSEGHSTAEIGRRLGVSKNAVVGKAHRLDLPARPSPIRRDGSGARSRPPTPRRVAGPTLPPLSSTATITTITGGGAPSIEAPVLRAPPAAAAPRVAAVARPPGRVIACCWPMGEPGSRSFRFCDAQSAPGKPYCADHASIAYVRVKDRREDAA